MASLVAKYVKKENAWVEAGIHFGICFCTILIFLSYSQGTKYLHVLTIGIGLVALIGWVGTIPMLCRMVSKQWMLGEDACSVLQSRIDRGEERINSLVCSLLTQETVDTRLLQLALMAHRAFDEQRGVPFGDEAARTRAEAKSLIAKQAFWEAHRNAAVWKFAVKPKITDYNE